MTVQKFEELGKDVVLEILSDPQSYPFDTVRLAGRQAASIIATLEAQLAEAKAVMRAVYDWMNQLPIPTTGCTSKMQLLYDALSALEITPAMTEAWQVKDHADGWIDFATAEEALAEVRVMGSALIRPAPTVSLEGDNHVRT